MTRAGRGLLLALALLLPACAAAPAPGSGPESAPVYALPFGLEQAEGTEARGRPAVYEDVLLEFRGEPVEVTRLRAAYAVTAEDPVEVFRGWLAQLATLPLPELLAGPGTALESGQWLQASAFDVDDPEAPPAGSAQLQLWTTGGDPVLLVDVALAPGAGGPPPPSVPPVEAPPRPEPRVGDPDAGPGDELFTEQGDRVSVPDGAAVLVPTLPVPGGTGGSASVLRAPDGEAAVRAMLEEAGAQSDAGEVTGPQVRVRDGVQVVTASYVVPAGGWGFSVVAVQGTDDEHATLHVRSGAD